MTEVVYVGPSDEITLAPSAGGITFHHGQPVEVDDELAAQLLEQATFRRAEPSKHRGKPKDPSPESETAGRHVPEDGKSS